MKKINIIVNYQEEILTKLLNDFTKEDSRIYKEEFEDFLPEKIYDFHVHLWDKGFYNLEISTNRIKQNPFLDPEIVQFTYEDFIDISKKLFPGKEYRGLFFGFPIKEIDLEKNNRYITEINIKNISHGLFMPKPDLKELPADFFKNGFIGFKPYPDLLDFSEPDDFSKLDIDVGIFDFISETVLEFCQEYGLILLIHIPRKGRLNDKRNIEDIKVIGKRYPKVKIILAHAGRSYCYSDIKDSINYLKELKNLYVDTAMINSFSVNKVLLEELGPERVIYGSDLAVAALKGKNIDINNRHYFVTKNPKAWSLSSSDMELNNFTFFIYEIIRAIKVAVKSLNLSKESIENIFYLNSRNIINNILNNID